MNAALGGIFLSVGVLLVVVALPRGGEARSFLRGDFGAMLYPVLCLGLIVVGVALLVSSLTS
jgi:hypothetical protein